jgi:enterochelin esterase-like enzyme
VKRLAYLSISSALIAFPSTFHLAHAAPPTRTASADVSSEGDGDYKIGPEYRKAPELTVGKDVPRGAVHQFVMSSEESKIYPGLNGPYKREVWAYVPAQYKPETPAPFMVVQDAMARGSMTATLDNLIHQRKLPAMIVIFIKSGGGDGKGSERGLEYDTVSDRYTTFIETEVLPQVSKEYHVTFTKDPEGRGTMGGSSGAACAFTMAWFHPELYHRVLSYSGTFVDQQSPKNPQTPHGAWEYHEHLIPASERKPIRVYLEVGENDNNFTKDTTGRHNWIAANQHMAEVLKAKGYHYRFEFAQGAKHVDGRVVNQTFPEALLWLWRGYPVQ